MDLEREFDALSEQGPEPLTHQHATSYGMLTWLELRRVQIFHYFDWVHNFRFFIWELFLHEPAMVLHYPMFFGVCMCRFLGFVNGGWGWK